MLRESLNGLEDGTRALMILIVNESTEWDLLITDERHTYCMDSGYLSDLLAGVVGELLR